MSDNSQQHPNLWPGWAGARDANVQKLGKVQCSINSDTSSCVSVSNQSVSSSPEPAVVPFLPPSLRQGQGEKPKKAASTARQPAEKNYKKNAMIDKLMCLIKTQVSFYLGAIKIIETLILFAVQSH